MNTETHRNKQSVGVTENIATSSQPIHPGQAESSTAINTFHSFQLLFFFSFFFFFPRLIGFIWRQIIACLTSRRTTKQPFPSAGAFWLFSLLLYKVLSKNPFCVLCCCVSNSARIKCTCVASAFGEGWKIIQRVDGTERHKV